MEEQHPIVFNKYLVSLTKIASVYCFFFIVLKAVAIFSGAWMIPNLILSFPFILMGILTAYTVVAKKYSWAVTIVAILLILIIRFYEKEWVFWLQTSFSN
jgi:hypothetical protein